MNKRAKRILELIEGEKSFGLQFYEKTKTKKIYSPVPSTKWPQSWKTVHYKTYPRLRAFMSKKALEKKSHLIELIHHRHTARNFTGEKIPFDDFFSLIQNTAGITYPGNSFDGSTRAYASAGARYPLELYALVLNVTDLLPGLYHYSVKENLIELLYAQRFTSELDEIFGDEPWITKASVVFFITGIPERTAVKYGDRGHRFMYIETGLLAQNISLLATEMGFGTCLVGGFVEDEVIKLFDLQIQGEYPLLSIALGKINKV